MTRKMVLALVLVSASLGLAACHDHGRPRSPGGYGRPGGGPGGGGPGGGGPGSGGPGGPGGPRLH